ncbi:MAG: 3-oxoacyl-ACP reductase FabG [Achromobacter sp.]|uniref:3-oxoacyl-ACP reductase FabG n=1 Tax=Achromobacter sp. TaxID=134375 RepID=UPI0025859942|nr:3-oxoacyl-ACP reductase FabG [Achromobacter sp.]MCW0210849.1 3-oxoacyl-ACP reductase FabG [Achromobacter sp.]
MDLGLEGKVAVVTGGGSGIGAAICAQLVREGATVVVADINGQAAQAQADALAREGGRAHACQVDVTDEASVLKLFERAGAEFGGVDILVNNAGFTRDMRITRMGLEDWDSVVDVILKGAFLCTREAARHFAEKKWGRVINISSRAHLGNAGQANYSAAKAGLIGFTRAMALEHGRHNVTVNAVAPGIIDTEAVRRLPHYEKVREAAQATTPIPRIGHVNDVASVVAFLASEPAGYLTGDVVHVTGGRY